MTLSARLFSVARSGRLAMTGLLAAATVLLCACGGGGSDSTSFDVAVVVSGSTVDTVSAGSRATSLAVPVNSSFELDASEPVRWTLYVGNTAVSGNSTVLYGGVEVSVTALTSSRVAIDTYSAYALSQSVPITLIATSTYDAAQVATVYIYITN